MTRVRDGIQLAKLWACGYVLADDVSVLGHGRADRARRVGLGATAR